MAQTRPCDVSPTGDQDKYTVAFMDGSGRWWGLDVPLTQIYPSTTTPHEPLSRVSQNSFHGGRGADRFQQEQFDFSDGYNGWSTTPGKYHATLLQKWAKGLRNENSNMPNLNGVTFKPLVGSTKYLSVPFVASASYSATKIILIIRRKVPAGTVGAPGTFTVELCNNDSGFPGTTIQSDVVTSDTITDVVSVYHVFSITSSALTNGTTYHIKVYGDATDRDKACWEIGCDVGAIGARSTNNSTWTATDFSPYYRITDADAARQFKTFIHDGAFYAVAQHDDGATASRLFMNGVRGRAVGTQTSTTLQDTGFGTYAANFPTNRFVNAYIRIIRGTGRGQVRQITANDANTFTVSPAWGITPVAGSSEYVVYSTDWFVEITSTGLGVVTGTPVVANGIVYFPQGDSVAIRKMQIDYTDADDHAFASETATNANKAYFLETGYDNLISEPVLWRVNQSATSGSIPNASGVSASRAPTSPLGVPVPFASDLLFGTSILAGENTNLITNIHVHEDNLYIFKEDSVFFVGNDRASQMRLGTETSPDIENGRAAATAGDKQLYMAFRGDVFLISGGGAYPTGMKRNMPSNRLGVVNDLEPAEGWLFAAINGGTNNISSVMKFALDTKTWSEQLRGFHEGRRIRNLQWQNCPETRPRLWVDIEGEFMYQEFPINYGVRPYDDKEILYQHEAGLNSPTIDLETTDPKYFATLTVTSQGLAQVGDTESGHVLVVEVQTDNDVGSDNWEHVGFIRTSPVGSVNIRRGNARMMRYRLRLLSDEAMDPVIVETWSLSLYARNRLAHEYTLQFPILSDDEEQNSVDLLMALRDFYGRAEPLTMLSRFTLFHDKAVTLQDEPRYNLEELDPTNNELEAQVWLKVAEVI